MTNDMDTTLPADESAATATPSTSGPTLLQPLRVRDFRLLFSGETISVLGDQFHFVALAWLALQLTGSGLALGTVLMTAAIPRAAFMLLGGAFSDRISPRSLILVSNAVRGVTVGTLAVVVLSGTAQLWHLYIFAAVFGVVDAFFYPALGTIVPMLVPARLLPPANAVIQGSAQIMGLVGPALAGAMIAVVQTGPAFVIDAASFAVAVAAIALVRGGRRLPSGPSEPQESVMASIGGGLRAAWADPAIRGAIVLTTAFNLAINGPISVGLAWLADERFAGGSTAFGLMFSAWGAGALIGAVVGGSITRIPHFGSMLLGAAALIGVGLAAIGFAPSAIVAGAILAAMGVMVGLINVQFISWLQRRVQGAQMGRMMSLVMLGSVGLAPVSLAAAGFLIDLGAATLMFAMAGGIVLAATVAGFAWGMPRLMDTDRSPAD
ncbi:MAG: MFS transporter [Chloroflexi bacterium]|nr:MFS transporter [Chloroflexota bacterium]